MKISRLNLYVDMCKFLNKEPNIKGLNNYDRELDVALRELDSKRIILR